MKKLLSTLCSLAVAAILTAQAPNGISYQSVIRNSGGTLITNQNVGIKISILQGSPSGTAVYAETQSATTNANGLASTQIGSGTVVSGNFANIDWANGPFYIKTETDPSGGTNYSITGTSQLLSVPYALYAKTATNAWGLTGNAGTNENINFIGTTDAQPLIFKVDNEIAGKVSPSNFNTSFGRQALLSNTTGDYNTATGYNALNSNTTGYSNTANGYKALYENTTGANNTANGSYALYSNTTGYSNTANGYQALNKNTTGYSNTANGYQALNKNTTGNDNTANGSGALGSNTTGGFNTANGSEALYFNTTGNANTANGLQALNKNTTGYSNTANGSAALNSNTTGNSNTANGSYALNQNITGSYNTGLGYSVDVDVYNRTNTVVIGGSGNIALGGNNRVRIGNSSMSSIGGQVAWTNLSDERIKTNVQSKVVGLDFIMKLKPVTYNYSVSKSYEIQQQADTTDWKGKYDIEKMEFSGFLAQEVEKAAKAAGYNFSGVDKPDSEKGLWGLRYAEFVVPMVKAMQEQQDMIKEQRSLVQEQQKQLQEQQDMIKEQQKMLSEQQQRIEKLERELSGK